MKLMQCIVLTCILFFVSSLNAKPLTGYDPCDLASGSWDGDYYDFKNNCGCHAWYTLYKANENILFHPVMDGCIQGCSFPPEFPAVCKNAKINSTFDSGFSGPVYDGIMELRNTNYYLRLYNK